MAELKKKAAADKSDKTVKDLIWLLFDTSCCSPQMASTSTSPPSSLAASTA